MTVNEETLKALRARVSQATTAKARAAVEHEQAEAAREAALTALKAHGVATAAEAGERLKALEKELDDALAEVETALEEAGA